MNNAKFQQNNKNRYYSLKSGISQDFVKGPKYLPFLIFCFTI